VHFIGLALYAEGPTDYYFLRPLLLRLCSDICLRKASAPVEFSEEVLALNHSKTMEDRPRPQRILDAAKQARGAWRILFVHTDGAGDPERARHALAEPALDLLRQECATDGIGIAVVPVRETEAWSLVDGSALRAVFGTNLEDRQLGLPPINGVESLPDPKQTLDDAFAATKPPPTRKRKGASPMLSALGDAVSLDRLRHLNGFRRLERDLEVALRQLNVLGQP
jgi:hypothetical protein